MTLDFEGPITLDHDAGIGTMPASKALELPTKPPSDDVGEFLELLHPEGVYEIRIISTPSSKGGTFRRNASGYFSRHDVAAKEVTKWARMEPPGIYCTLNPVNPSLLARSVNKIQFNPKHTTTDADILRRRWLLIDIDPKRPSGMSATDTEKQKAIETGRAIRQWLSSRGWPDPIRMMSGNGCYAIYRIDLPNDEQATELLRSFLHALAERFNSDTADVDRSVYNASRILKIGGTWARKGDNLVGFDGIEDRPHRQSYFVAGDEVRVVDREQIQAVVDVLATERPGASQPTEAAEQASGAVAGTDDERIVRRYRAMLAKWDPAIDGQGGSQKMLEAAAEGARFGLSKAAARPVLSEYSDRCLPPWSESEIDHKQDDGYEKAVAKGEWGKRLQDDPPAGKSPNDPSSGREPVFKPITAAELDAGDYKLNYLITGLLVEHQNMMIGGQFKTMKTSFALDAGISLASASKFLNQFDVPEKRRTMILTAESGLATIQESCRRICRARDIALKDIEGLSFCDRVPRLENPTHTSELKEIIEGEGIQVLIADPAYLMLDGDSAGNVFSMGEQLGTFATLARETAATPVLLHHAKKNTLNAVEYQPLELADLAWAGFAEFARQWLLLSRRERYAEGTGEHRLWMSVGGSAGHNGCWGVDVSEGHPDDEGGRRWDVSISDAKGARESAAKEAEERREAAKQAKAAKALEANREKVVSAFRGMQPARLTKKGIRDRGGLNASSADTAIAYMLRTGELSDGHKIRAANNQEYDAFELHYEKISS